MCLGVPGQLDGLFEEQGLAMGRVSFGGVTRIRNSPESRGACFSAREIEEIPALRVRSVSNWRLSDV